MLNNKPTGPGSRAVIQILEQKCLCFSNFDVRVCVYAPLSVKSRFVADELHDLAKSSERRSIDKSEITVSLLHCSQATHLDVLHTAKRFT